MTVYHIRSGTVVNGYVYTQQCQTLISTALDCIDFSDARYKCVHNKWMDTIKSVLIEMLITLGQR